MFIIFNTGKSGKEIIRYDNKLQDVLHTKEKISLRLEEIVTDY